MILLIVAGILVIAVLGYVFKLGDVFLQLISKGVKFFFTGVGKIIGILIVAGLLVSMCS